MKERKDGEKEREGDKEKAKDDGDNGLSLR